MADTFWNTRTPVVADADRPRAWIPVRIAGAAADGSQDIFAQVALPSGSAGKSAYQIWLDQGNTGTEADFLASLAGAVTAGTIVGALGFTPYDSANPASYVTLTGARGALSADTPLAYNPTTGKMTIANLAAGTILGNPGTDPAAPTATTIAALLGYTPADATALAAKANTADLAHASNTTPGTSFITASQYRTLQQLLSTWSINVMDRGAKGTGTGAAGVGDDDWAAFISAFTSGARRVTIPYVGQGKCYRLSNTLSFTGLPVILQGDGCQPYVTGTASENLTDRGVGSWLFCDHNDEGLHLEGNGFEVSGLAMVRKQPLASSTYGTFSGTTVSGSKNVSFTGNPIPNIAVTGSGIPTNTYIVSVDNTAHTLVLSQAATASSTVTLTMGFKATPNNFDWVFLNGDMAFGDLFSLNPTNMMTLDYNGGGRVRGGSIRGAPYEIGLRIDRQLDEFKIDQIFWQNFDGDNASLSKAFYRRINRIGLDMGHCDGGKIGEYFDFGGHISIYTRPGAGDSIAPTRIDIERLYSDTVGQFSVYTSVSGTDIGIKDFQSQGAATGDNWPTMAQNSVVVASDNTTVELGNSPRMTRFAQQMGIVTGASSKLSMGSPYVEDYNLQNIGATAFSAGSSSTSSVEIRGNVRKGNQTYPANIIDTSGRISSNEWIGFTGSASSVGGTGSGSMSARYNRVGTVVNYQMQISGFSGGSTGTGISVALPVPSDGTMLQTMIGGYTGNYVGIHGVFGGGSSTMLIQKLDGSYPAPTSGSETYYISGSYRCAA